MTDLIPVAMAATTTAAQPAGGGLNSIIMIALFLFVGYFMLIRPQTKRAKEQKQLLSSLSEGDEIVTTGGLLGVIDNIDNDIIELKLAENLVIKIQKVAVSALLPKGTVHDQGKK